MSFFNYTASDGVIILFLKVDAYLEECGFYVGLFEDIEEVGCVGADAVVKG